MPSVEKVDSSHLTNDIVEKWQKELTDTSNENKSNKVIPAHVSAMVPFGKTKKFSLINFHKRELNFIISNSS